MLAYEKKLDSKMEEEEKKSEEYGFAEFEESANVIMDDYFDESRPGSRSRPGSQGQNYGKSPMKSKEEDLRSKVNMQLE
jgi:hypothetical protein